MRSAGDILAEAMTKVEVEYLLEFPVNDQTMEAISLSHAVYGLRKVSLTPSMDRLMVTYDASRMQLPDVEHALRASGLAVMRLP